MIRDVIRGIVPQRQRVSGAVPFNLMKSETLVWVTQGCGLPGDCGSPGAPGHLPRCQHPCGRGLYYRPSTFRSRTIEWEETGPRRHRDAGAHDQAHLLHREAEAAPGPLRPDHVLPSPMRMGPGSRATPGRPSPKHSKPATAGPPTTWRQTWPRSRDEPLTLLSAATPLLGSPRRPAPFPLLRAPGNPGRESSMTQNEQPQPRRITPSEVALGMGSFILV